MPPPASRGTVVHVRIDVADLAEILGAARSSRGGAAHQRARRRHRHAWTPVGGDILFIEATRVPGHGKLILTGQLGDVMKESAQAALSLVIVEASRARHSIPSLFDESDIPRACAGGAIPKDGRRGRGHVHRPGLAGHRPRRRSDLSMTGEISLRGLVLAGRRHQGEGVAAMLAGIKTVICRPAPQGLEDIPEETRLALQFVWLETVDQALATALAPARVTTMARDRHLRAFRRKPFT